VGVYYYAWHANDFHRGDGYLRDQLSEKQPPLLGEYDDRQKDIIAQHLLWSRRANVRLWVCSWWGPSSREDLTIRNNILTHPDLGFQQESNHKIALLYEISGRGLKESANWDTSNSYDDLAYICKNYFDHPNYYQLNEKSVIVIYLTRKLLAAGVLEVVLTDMRKAAKETCGTDIFIIGDHVWNFPPNIDDGDIYWPLIPGKYRDALTNYDVYGNVGVTPYAGSVAIDKHWDKEATAWKRFANVRGVAYIPGTSAGYNDRGIRPENDNPGLSRKLGGPEDEHGSLFAAHLVKARKLVETKDILSDPLLLVNSWNEWHEDSQIEPITVDGGYTNEPEILTSGLDYESYGFKYLDILHRATCGNDTDINDNELGLLFHEGGSEGTSKSCTTARRYATSSIVAIDDGPRIVDFTGDTKTAVSLILQHDPFKTDPPPNDVLVGILYYPIESNRLNFRSQIGGQTIVGEEDGNYDKIDRDTIQRHLKLSQQANIGMWVISWYGSGTGSDSSLRNLILSEEGLGESDMQIVLIYQIRDRIPNFRTVKPSLWDWSKVESDIESLCNTDDGILNHPNYFRVGKDNEIKRPVLILGLTRWFHQEGELSTLVSKIRNKVKEKCSDFVTGRVALIGDQVWKSAPIVSNNYDSFQNNDGDDDGKNYAPFDLLDAVMNIDVSSNMGRKGYAGSDAVDSFYQEQREWRDAAWRGKSFFFFLLFFFSSRLVVSSGVFWLKKRIHLTYIVCFSRCHRL
jgi:glycoprotein endo-alpha-1,2-mannosidase